jgi:hypothetical protein
MPMLVGDTTGRRWWSVPVLTRHPCAINRKPRMLLNPKVFLSHVLQSLSNERGPTLLGPSEFFNPQPVPTTICQYL